MQKLGLIVATLLLVAMAAEVAQAQRGVNCTSTRIGNTTYTNCR